jgi:hypothetical protein
VETEKKNGEVGTKKNPARFREYNKFMRGVGWADQIWLYFLCYKKILKWTKKFVFLMLHMAALNRIILLKKNRPIKIKGHGLYF